MGMLDKISNRSTDGRELKYWAEVTRQKLLDELAGMVSDGTPWRDIGPARIARRAGKAPATFYQYFRNVEEAFLVMMNEFALSDLEVGRRFHVIRQFIIDERDGYECDHVYEYVWDKEAHVTRGTCTKCGDGMVVNHVE